MSEPPLLVATAGPVRTLTLNRPASLNAFTAEMHGLLLPALDAAAADPAVRAVVITGAGRGFCAGQDLADPAMRGEGVDVGAVVERFYKPLAPRAASTRAASKPMPELAPVMTSRRPLWSGTSRAVKRAITEAPCLACGRCGGRSPDRADQPAYFAASSSEMSSLE